MRSFGLLTSAGFVAGGLYVVEDSKCSGEICPDLGGGTIGSALILTGFTLAIVSVIASEVAHKKDPKPVSTATR